MITGIIMASGYSRRMGTNKLLMDFKGKKIIEYVIEATIESRLNEVLLIYKDEIIKNIGNYYGIKTIYNDKSHMGQSQSIVYGVENATYDSYMFFTGDQPFITAELIDFLIESHKNNKEKIIIPCYKGKRYTPTIFPKLFKEDLLNIEGDQGGRNIIKNNPKMVKKINIWDEKLLIDIDTQDEFDYWTSTQIE